MITCPAGEINAAAVTDSGVLAMTAGVINAGQPASNYCLNTAFTDPYNCNQLLDLNLLYQKIAASNGLTTATLGDLSQYQKYYDFYYADATTQAECWGSGSQLFVQVACTIPADDLLQR